MPKMCLALINFWIKLNRLHLNQLLQDFRNFQIFFHLKCFQLVFQLNYPFLTGKPSESGSWPFACRNGTWPRNNPDWPPSWWAAGAARAALINRQMTVLWCGLLSTAALLRSDLWRLIKDGLLPCCGRILWDCVCGADGSGCGSAYPS